MKGWLTIPALAMIAGCGDESGTMAPLPDGSTGDVFLPDQGPIDRPPGTASLLIEQPSEGATFARDDMFGVARVATFMITSAAEGITTVYYRLDGSVELGSAIAPPWLVVAHVASDGPHTITAIGVDGQGAVVAMDETTITVGSPLPGNCHERLDALGLDWSVAPENRGIADPVWIEPTIAGVAFRYAESASPSRMLMDCELADSLVALAELVAGYGIDEVIHLGIYNYRCIGGGDPDRDMCTPSQHAFARAIDLHAFGLAGSSEEYNVETDWTIRSGDTCPGTSAGMADDTLHDIACELWSGRVFNIVLTPNYNAAHRNHFHVDLTDGAHTIHETVGGIDPLLPSLGD